MDTILFRNPREAKYEIVIHFLKVYMEPELKRTRDKVFDYLRKSGLNAFVALEPTDDGFGNPNDCVHFHILTDDMRGIDALRELGRTVCLAAGLQDKAVCNAPENEFDVECRGLYDYAGYIDYVTKHNREDEVHLFIRGSRMQRFYFLNDWYIDADGNRRNKTDIWDEIKQETAARERSRTKREQQKSTDVSNAPNIEVEVDRHRTPKMREDDRFVWLPVRNDYVKIDKRLFNFIPDFDFAPTDYMREPP